jgi:hypothetical protein
MPSSARARTVFAPASWKSKASTADVSRTTLLTVFPPGFFVALTDQLINDADPRDAVRGKSLLRGTNSLGEGLQVDALGVAGEDEVLPRTNAKLLSYVGRDDHAASRIYANAGELWYLGISHDVTRTLR